MIHKSKTKKSGGADLSDISKKEKKQLLKNLWNEKDLREFFYLGTQNKEWLDVLNSLQGSLTYSFPKFKLLDDYHTAIGNLVPYYWGNHRDSFHRYIERFLNIKEDDHELYFHLIGNKTPLYEYIFECIMKLYQDEYNSTENHYQHPKCILEVELKEIPENTVALMTMISAGRFPDLTNSLEDRRTIWKFFKELNIKVNKTYTLPDLLQTIFDKLVVHIDILPKSIKRNSSPQSSPSQSLPSPIGEKEAMAYLYREFFLD